MCKGGAGEEGPDFLTDAVQTACSRPSSPLLSNVAAAASHFVCFFDLLEGERLKSCSLWHLSDTQRRACWGSFLLHMLDWDSQQTGLYHTVCGKPQGTSLWPNCTRGFRMHIGAACRMTLQPMGPTYTMNNCNIPLHITLLLCLSPAPFLSNALQTIVVRLGVLKKINIVILPALQMGKMKLRDITQQASGSARNRNHDPRFPVPGSNHLQWELGHGYTYKLTAAQLFRYSCATVRSLV